MVDIISRIQQLMAESRYVEAQKEAEISLSETSNSNNSMLLELYFQSLLAQSRPLPSPRLIDFLELIVPHQIEKSLNWISYFTEKDLSHFKGRLLLVRIQLAEARGLTEELYRLLNEFQIYQFEKNVPFIPELIQKLIQKYFSGDFHLKLQLLALNLKRKDLVSAENLIKEMILSCIEKSSPKGTKEKLSSLVDILDSSETLYHLEVYKSFCHFMVEGVGDKKELKKVIELIIYMDDFKMQSLLLDLLHKGNLKEVAEDYANVLKNHKDYSYVYFDKFLPHLKIYFFQRSQKSAKEEVTSGETIDLKVEKFQLPIVAQPDIQDVENLDEEILLANLLRYQSFQGKELLDISVSFLQSDFPRAALKAANLALEKSADEDGILKASYLKVMCLFKLGDYRAALDVSLSALSISKTENDILSFLYSQAEAHLRLKENKQAKAVLKRIISIDSGYRLARERLERLNEI